jgi:hypothetical protein
MSVVLAVIRTGTWQVDCCVHSAPVSVGEILGISTNQTCALLWGYFRWKQHENLATQQGVAPIRLLCGIPEGSSVASPVQPRGGGMRDWQENFLVNDIVTAGEVIDLPCALVANALACAISG